MPKLNSRGTPRAEGGGNWERSRKREFLGSEKE